MAQKGRPAFTEIRCQVGRAAAFRLHRNKAQNECFSYKTQSIFMAIFRGLILVEVRILPAAPEMRACVSFPSYLHFLV